MSDRPKLVRHLTTHHLEAHAKDAAERHARELIQKACQDLKAEILAEMDERFGEVHKRLAPVIHPRGLLRRLLARIGGKS